MTTLLEELSVLDKKKKYSIVLNGTGSFQFVTAKTLKLANIQETHKDLLDFKLLNKKMRGSYCVLEFGGKTRVARKELVQFLLDIIGFKKRMFHPELLTVAVTKKEKEKPIVIAASMRQNKNGEIIRDDLKSSTTQESLAILGDYYFKTYDEYQTTMQCLADIWVNE